MKRRISFFLLLYGLTVPAPSAGELSGYFKNFTVLYDFPESTFLGPSNSVLAGTNSRFRINGFWRSSDAISFTIAYDFAPVVQDKDLTFTLNSNFDENRRAYRAFDFDNRLVPGADEPPATFSIFHNLDRAHVTIRMSAADLFIGRQAIAWGSARVVNPTDVIAPFTYNELDVEDRVGVDAIRLRKPIGQLGELDVGYVFGRDFDFESSAFFLRSKFYYLSTDLALLTVGFKENLLVGFDLARALGGAGVWLEAGHVLAGVLGSAESDRAEDYFRLSLGLDYTLKDGTYLFAEYHHSQAGSGTPADYLLQLQNTAFQDGAVFLLGRHYLAPGFSRPITLLLSVGGQLLINLGDGSFFAVPNFEYNLADNFYLAGGLYLGIGRNQQDSRPGSEFGSYPDLYFTSVRFYF